MVKRPPGGIFGEAWVFPGGLVDDADGRDEEGYRNAAARELYEEVALEVDSGKLVYLSRWITPELAPRRYDTWFFLAQIPEIVAVSPVTEEIVDAQFITPAAALSAHQAQQWKLVLPTLTHLQWLAHRQSADEAMRAIPTSRDPIEPRMAPDGSLVALELPW
jgi:8-oxo-dGTP pyrophosphatase MutT (NUDIX family)